MYSCTFLVDVEPFVVWDADIQGRTKQFLKGLDPSFFEYTYKAHLHTEDDKRASVALRLCLHHSLETFFSLVGAFVQAPDCPFAWIAKCSTPALRSLIEKISRGDESLFTKLNVSSPTWNEISRCTHLAYLPGTSRQNETVEGFAGAWARMAHEFLTREHTDEYNSLKHGFRIRSGGFGLAIAHEEVPGERPPDAAFKNLGKSDYGAAFFQLEPLTTLKGERSLTIVDRSMNWSLQRIILLNQVAYISINNMVSALRVANNFPPSECLFLRPEEQSDFLSAWSYSTGIGSMAWRTGVPERARSLSRQEILDALKPSAS